MGLLSEGQPMEWEDMVEWQGHVRLQSIMITMSKMKIILITPGSMEWNSSSGCTID